MFSALLLLPALLAGCENPCIHMCQTYERYLDRCGYGWSTTFHDEGWTSLDDCYADHWEVPEREFERCEQEEDRFEEKACY